MFTVPKNLNNELLENALVNAFSDKCVKVLNFYIKPAVVIGENFTSDVFRVLVDYQIKSSEPKQISLIVKYMLEAKAVVDMVTDYKLYIKEKELYTNFLPKLSKMFNEDFAPKCHYIMEEPSKVFVMEDLKDLGFSLSDRQAGLDLESCLMVVKKLAKWHAGSMIIAEKEPELMEDFDFGLINKKSNSGSALPLIMLEGLKTLIEETSTWPNFEEIVEKLKKIQVNFEERALRCIDQESSFKVLNHGDLWTSNLMIKFDENKIPADLLFVRYL